MDLIGTEREDGTRTPDLTLEDLARESENELEDCEEVLHLMQLWDPIGACSRSLQECLKVQAEAFGYEDIEIQIIEKHLHNLEKHNYAAIARDLKMELEDVYEAVKEIQKLESRPARNFSETDEKTIAITPDVYVIKDGDRFVVLEKGRRYEGVPGSPDYRAKYYGDLRSRDAAYHQGTVWGWLIGPFVDAS